MHTSVFLEEAVEALQVKPGGTYIDATFGQGGHSQLIAEKGGQVLAIDLDPQIESLRENIRVIKGNFADIQKIAESYLKVPVDGILFDFGLSMNQLSESNRGFSFKKEHEPLDMRLSGEGLRAADVLNTYTREELEELFMRFAEDTEAYKYAREISIQRRKKEFETVGDLVTILNKSLGEREAGKKYARIFQALRIEVNKEYETIRKGLEGALEIVKSGGVIVTITFHSLEDRWVKRFIREHKDEVEDTRVDVEKMRQVRPFERSATLRVIRKK